MVPKSEEGDLKSKVLVQRREEEARDVWVWLDRGLFLGLYMDATP